MNLDQWLNYLEKLHPSTVDLGLERIRRTAECLEMDIGESRLITVAGTNGKGSCVTLLDHILRAADYTTATYTSPHLLRYNERVCLNGQEVDDDTLCLAFEVVEKARKESNVSLTYFEFGTLAALHIFSQFRADFVILEVGLGGRLDAVNLLDADVTIVTNVAFDHMEWLGNTREDIGYEKAGIYRTGKPAIYGETDMPQAVADHIADIGALPFVLGEQFKWGTDAGHNSCNWQGVDGSGNTIFCQELPLTTFAGDNLASVLQALFLLLPELSRNSVIRGLETARIRGRFERIARGHEVILDVAHNPHAAGNLALQIKSISGNRRLHIVIAMLKDKDMQGVATALSGLGANWYVGQITAARGSEAKILYNLLLDQGETVVGSFESVAQAFAAAESDAMTGDIVLVTGSFYTVSAVMEVLEC